MTRVAKQVANRVKMESMATKLEKQARMLLVQMDVQLENINHPMLANCVVKVPMAFGTVRKAKTKVVQHVFQENQTFLG